eukprot:scaffold2452_cov60-Cyclotella_meneghiniana.AAC.1
MLSGLLLLAIAFLTLPKYSNVNVELCISLSRSFFYFGGGRWSAALLFLLFDFDFACAIGDWDWRGARRNGEAQLIADSRLTFSSPFHALVGHSQMNNVMIVMGCNCKMREFCEIK